MGNLFLNLPLPVLNGPGAAVDVSAMGAPRTITCVGSFLGSTIAIEASSDGGATFSPLTAFQNKGGEQVLPAVVQFVRTLVSGRKLTVPFSADVDIAASDAGSQFAVLPLPVLNGPGAAVDVSAFGDLTTMVVTGAFAGAAVAVEISEDNLVWAVLVAFGGQGGIKTKVVTASWARASVSGRKATVPFSAVVAIGATDYPTPVTPSVIVADEGVPLGSFTELDFVGGGVTATDAGGGIAQIDVPTPTIVGADEGTPLGSFTEINFTGGGITATDAGGGVLQVNVAGGGGGTIDVEDEGVLVGSFTTLDFAGAGVAATDAGGGVALVTIPGPPADTKQVFRYVVTGLEANPFPVALPAARASNNYNVQCTFGGPAANAFKDYRPLASSFAVGTFDVECGAVADAGDVLMFTVEDLT